MNKSNSEFVRLRYVDDLRIVSTPSKTEKIIYGPNHQSHHNHHINNPNCINTSKNKHEHSQNSPSRVHSQQSHSSSQPNRVLINRTSSTITTHFNNVTNSRKNSKNN